MSVKITSAVWTSSKSSGRARLVLLAIADHQGEIGAWPSIPTLAKMVNASERSVQRDIQELIDMGELIRHEQAAPSRGQYKANLYWVNLPSVAGDISGVTNNESGVTESQSGVTELASGVTVGGALTITRTITEPFKRSTTLPNDFKVTESMFTWAVEKVPNLNLEEETEKFELYHSSKNSKFVDWSKAWRSWMLNAKKWTKTDNSGVDPWAGKRIFGDD